MKDEEKNSKMETDNSDIKVEEAKDKVEKEDPTPSKPPFEKMEVTVEETKVIKVKEEEVKDKKGEKGNTSSGAGADSSSSDKKVILLNTIALSNMFKTPLKAPSGASVGGATSSKKGDTSNGSPNVVEMRKLTQQLASALTSNPKKRVFCSNTNCNLKTDTLVDAPSYARCYFGMSRHGSVKICMYCMKKAENFNQQSKKMVLNKENLFKLPVEIQTQETVVDLESPVASPECTQGCDSTDMTDEYMVEYEKLNEIVMEALEKFGLEEQVKKCTSTVNEDCDNLAEQFSELDLEMERVRDEIDLTTKNFNDYVTGGVPQAIVIGSIELNEDGDIAEVHARTDLDQIRGVDALSRIAARDLGRALAELKAIEATPPPVITPAPVVLERVVAKDQGPNVGQNRAQLIFQKPKMGQEVYAMPKHQLHYWLPARIRDIDTQRKPTMYKVQFSVKVKPRSKSTDDEDMYMKYVSGKEIAFKKPSTQPLVVGCRVIARFKDLLRTDEEVDGMLYLGVAAEYPKDSNKDRYLVFFDDGYAQYVRQDEIFPVVEASPEVWLDVDTNSRSFIRDYVQKYPNRHMIRAQIMAGFNVELNGIWLPAQIVEVDCSLMKVRYLRENAEGVEYEWIYRGSTRLGPLFTRIKSLEAKPTTTVARRHTYSSRNATFSFEVNQDNIEEEQSSGRSAVVKKHTGGLPFPAGQVVKTQDGVVISTALETKGNLVRINIPESCPTSRPYVTHLCSPRCAYVYEEEKYRKVSPLAIPFYLGWARQLTKTGQVYYFTPCGVRCASYRDIHAYVVHTHVDIPIDFFSLENKIDCLNAFEADNPKQSLKDISYGKEWTPVAMVNSFTLDYPTYMDYITERQVGEGVNLNDDDGFLTCCDCEDDCQDKDKCACYQLTMSGISFKIAKQEGTQLKTYENRRLKNHVLSGIYECNKNCKCRSTCFNRVVQNKVKWPVEIFKTVAKGWGVRALHDMPQGSFICVYTGQLLTDASANASGITQGDEFLAELDFIECNEQMKEDYEEDVTDIESEEPGTRSNARLAAAAASSSSTAPVANGQPGRQIVAKRSTGGFKVQKAVKSTGGIKRSDDDSSSTSSDVQAPRPVARKSGSKNGIKSMNRNEGGSTKSFSNTSDVPSPVLKKRPSKDDSDSDEDERTTGRAYSSFYATSTAKAQSNAPRLTLREYFGEDEAVYIMDAKSKGNFGRYLNHSCDPNVFVQNLFVDTHDPRFPWVAFFTKKDVKAGTELTWDYNYEIGSVPGKTLFCYCLQLGCRGKLL